MILRVPSYYKTFQCIADKCEHSCCIGWEIDIDEDSYDYYMGIEGAFGERLKEQTVTEDEEHSFVLRKNGWCPFLDQNKLCDIYSELGEEALCEVCTEYPRFVVEYGDVREKSLSVSCEEVGRIIFSDEGKMSYEDIELPDLGIEDEFLYYFILLLLQMEDTLLDLLCSSLIPELCSDITAGTSCNRHFILIAVSAIRTLPD